MNGLVAAFFVFCPANAPAQCSQHDQGIMIERRWCGVNLGRVYYRPNAVAGKGRIECK